MGLVPSRNLSFNLRKTARTSSFSRNHLTNLTRRSRCTRDNWKNRNLSLTPISCVCRSSSVNLKALNQEPKKLSPPLTNSDPERGSLLQHPAVKNPLMFRKLRSLSRKPSTELMSLGVLPAPWPFHPVHLPNNLPPPPFNHQETCALDLFMLPVLAEQDLWLVLDQHTELPASGQVP